MAEGVNRRQLFGAVAAIGIGSGAFQRALAAQAEPEVKTEPLKAITKEMIQNAEWIAGITLTDDERKRIARTLTADLPALNAARKAELPNSTPFALHFVPSAEPASNERGQATFSPIEANKPANDDDLAFAGIPTLAGLLRSKQISSVELTKFYLTRLKKYDPALLCVVTLTEELALKQAKTADDALAKGKPKSLLHGIPWGAKDLIAYPGYPTTWGAEHFKEQTFTEKATVAQKLDDAGAVLIAKLTLGSLALGDRWFGGRTRNPWNVKLGSSGSSAGSAAAVSAGCVPFAIGSETLGSIVSPSRQCGVTGLRPTYGRVARTGCMTLSWSMDKLGPITRSAHDAAIVFDAIHGADGHDFSTSTRPFDWPAAKKPKEYTVGFFEEIQREPYLEACKMLKEKGVKLVPIKLPNPDWLGSLKVILDVESAAAFDPQTRAGIREGLGLWPIMFREAQFISAVEYINANRLRSKLMAEMAKLMKTVDAYIGGNDLFITNMTGHPSICVPSGFNKIAGAEQPQAITFTGQLHGESDLLTIAQVYQEGTKHHEKRPPLERATKANAEGK